MSDSVFNLESSEETSAHDDAPPEFGLVDIVEAFTAMRHEWRGQTKESRMVAESVQAAATNIQELKAKLLALTASSSTDVSRKLAELIADTDNQLTRAVAAAQQSELNRRRREASESKAIQHYFLGMNAIARWFARPLLTFVTEQRHANEQTTDNPAVEGLNLLLARLRRMMQEHQIQRIDALGKAFDAETMNAIGTVESQDYSSGYVAEQLSPSYRWRGSLLRFADVRVTS
jgi:molecular chaperone GrpE (heat shock protein)